MKKPTSIIAIFISACCFLGGCGSIPSPPESCREELSLHNWKTEQSDPLTLAFEGEILSIRFQTGGDELEISGRFNADDESITLYSADCGILVFPYRLENGKLILTYCGKELSLIKDHKDQ